MLRTFALLTALGAGLQAQAPLSVTRHLFPHQGLKVVETRTLDPLAGTVAVHAVDQEGRTVADVNALILREQDLKLSARRNVSPELREIMGRTPTGTPLEVMLWRRVPGRDYRDVMEAAMAAGVHYEEARRRARDAAEADFAPGNRTLAARLNETGCEVTAVCGPWPIVFARIPVERIERWATDAAVDQAYYSFPTWTHENVYAQPTLRSTTLHRRNITGALCTVKVMIQDTANLVTNCPYLPKVTLLNSYSIGSHAMGCAGNVCMLDHPGGHHGVAKGLPVIYSAGGSGDTRAPANWDLAIKAGVSFGNCSWWNGSKGKIVGLDRFFDYTIRQYAVMMFKSNGNQGTTSTPYGTTPGQGYNMTCSGCYNDGNSPDWADDKMAGYSSYRNPAEGHEKPEVASPGDSIMSTYRTSAGTTNWLGSFGGTSSASPLTCGTATLMATVDATLGARPEAVKAALMASAWHNVEGKAILSDKDGAGGVHATAAVNLVGRKRYLYEKLTAASFTNKLLERPITCRAGNETRVVALWFSVANSARTTDVLMMDLDMVILDPAKRVVASSAHAKNPFEILSFVPTTHGTYTVRLVQQRFTNASERLCLAWSFKEDRATNEVGLSGTGAIGTTMGVTFTDLYHPGQWYVGLASADSTGVLVMPGGYSLPFGWDSLASLSQMAFPGFVGKLDSKGAAKGSIPIPNLALFRGLKVNLAMLTLDTSLADLIEEISPATSFTVR